MNRMQLNVRCSNNPNNPDFSHLNYPIPFTSRTADRRCNEFSGAIKLNFINVTRRQIGPGKFDGLLVEISNGKQQR